MKHDVNFIVVGMGYILHRMYVGRQEDTVKNELILNENTEVRDQCKVSVLYYKDLVT